MTMQDNTDRIVNVEAALRGEHVMFRADCFYVVMEISLSTSSCK
jgi:hypothetical protein